MEETKICRGCKQPFTRPTRRLTDYHWRIMQFCSTECRMTAANKRFNDKQRKESERAALIPQTG
jgi:hypothetical protein